MNLYFSVYVINTEDRFNLDLLFIAFTEHREIRGILKTNVRPQMFLLFEQFSFTFVLFLFFMLNLNDFSFFVC